MTDKPKPDPACPWCNGSGTADSGGVHPWGEPALIPCGCSQDSPREQLRKATAPAGYGTFQHFASDAQRQAHLDDVAAGIERGSIPF